MTWQRTMPGRRPANAPFFRPAPAPSAPAGLLEALTDAPLGRSHRAKVGKAQAEARHRPHPRGARVPADYRIGIVPASDTGAVEMAMWSLLGARGVDMLAWESFGEGWVTDVVKQLKLEGRARSSRRAYGELPDLAEVELRHATSSSPGTAPPPACASPNARLDRGRPRGPDDLRRHLGGLRAAARLAEARCRHLLLAEGAGRRGRARHADPVAPRRRAARDLHAGLAAAEDLPHDQGRQAHRGHLRGRDHQHAVDALRRGLHRRAANGRSASAGWTA